MNKNINDKDSMIEKLRQETISLAVNQVKGGSCQRELFEKFNEYYAAQRTPGVTISQESEKGYREIVAKKIAIDCIPYLSKEELAVLDNELEKIASYKGLYETKNRVTYYEEGYDEEIGAHYDYKEVTHIDFTEEHDAAINQKVGMLRELLKSGDFTLTDAAHPYEKILDFEVGHYFDGSYSMQPILDKSGRQAAKEYDYEALNQELNRRLSSLKPKNLTVDFLGDHSMKSIVVNVSTEEKNSEATKVTGIIVKGLTTSTDHHFKLNGSEIIDASIDWGGGERDRGAAEYLIGHDLHFELGKDLANKILNMKDSGVIPYPYASSEGALVNDFYTELAFSIVEDGKKAIIDRTTSPSARLFNDKQVEILLRPDSRLSTEERIALFEDIWKSVDGKLAEARIPDAWKESAHDELMDLAKNGEAQHYGHGLRL